MRQEELTQVLAQHNRYLFTGEGAPADLRRANLDGLDLRYANLAYANMYEASCVRTDFTLATLTGAKLYGANLTEAKLAYVDLQRVSLAGVCLTGADTIIGGYDERGWLFYVQRYADRLMVRAGCRWFHTFDYARMHWEYRHKHRPSLQAACMGQLESLERQAHARGWIEKPNTDLPSMLNELSATPGFCEVRFVGPNDGVIVMRAKSGCRVEVPFRTAELSAVVTEARRVYDSF